MVERIQITDSQRPTKEHLKTLHKALVKSQIRYLEDTHEGGFNPIHGLLEALDTEHFANAGLTMKVRYHGHMADPMSYDDMVNELFINIIKKNSIQNNVGIGFIHKVKPIDDKAVVVTKGYNIHYVDNNGNDINKEVSVTHIHFIDSKRVVLFGVTFKDTVVADGGSVKRTADTLISDDIYRSIGKYCPHAKVWRVVHDVFYTYDKGVNIQILKLMDNSKWYKIISSYIVKDYGKLFLFNCFEFGGISKSLFKV